MSEEQEQRVEVRAMEEVPVNAFPADQVLHSSAWLISKYGDQAYWMAQRLAIQAIGEGRSETAKALGRSMVELIGLKYNKNPRDTGDGSHE